MATVLKVESDGAATTTSILLPPPPLLLLLLLQSGSIQHGVAEYILPGYYVPGDVGDVLWSATTSSARAA